MSSQEAMVAMLRRDKLTCFMVCCLHMEGQTHPWDIWLFMFKYISSIMTMFSIREFTRKWQRA